MTTVSTTEMSTATRMPAHSAQSNAAIPSCTALTTFTAMVIAQAQSRRMSMGSVSASQIRRRRLLRFARVNSFLPYFSACSFTFAEDSPADLSVSRRESASSGVCV